MHRKIKLPEGDILIHAGDATNRGTIEEVAAFGNWFQNLPYAHKIFCPGNHDFLFQYNPTLARELMGHYYGKCTVLIDESCTIEGIRFYGTPWTPIFNDWAFNAGTNELKSKFAQIPQDTDVLISHGPPWGILDKIDSHLGSTELATRIKSLNLKLHVFGHIHYSHGVEDHQHKSVNASICDEGYRAVNDPIVIEI